LLGEVEEKYKAIIEAKKKKLLLDFGSMILQQNSKNVFLFK
jgi:hypothetical protein